VLRHHVRHPDEMPLVPVAFVERALNLLPDIRVLIHSKLLGVVSAVLVACHPMLPFLSSQISQYRHEFGPTATSPGWLATVLFTQLRRRVFYRVRSYQQRSGNIKDTLTGDAHPLLGWHHVHGGKVYVCHLDYHGKRMNVCDIVEFEDGMIKADRGYFAEPFEAPEWRAQRVESF
jgi:hypothetical protein